MSDSKYRKLGLKDCQPRLIILRGNSGSGKSTLAKLLQYELGYKTMLIPQDVIRREVLRVKDVDGNPAIQLIGDLARYGKLIGYDVIVEGILPSAKYGDMLRSLVGEFGLQRWVYYFDISFEETLRRHLSKPNSGEFGEKEMKEWWVDKDFLGVKGESIFTDEMSQEFILQKLLADLRSS